MTTSRRLMNSCVQKPFPHATSTGSPHIGVQRACATIYRRRRGVWLYKRMRATYLLSTMMVSVTFAFCVKFGILLVYIDLNQVNAVN